MRFPFLLCLAFPLAAAAQYGEEGERADAVQVEIRAELVSVYKTDLHAAGERKPNTIPDLEMLDRLRREGKLRVLQAPQVITKSGVQVQIKAGDEVIYPTDLSLQTVTNPLGQVSVALTPSGFETRETGVILNATPTVGLDAHHVDLAVLAEFVEPPQWVSHPAKYVDAAGVEHVAEIKQPVFHARTVTTSVVLWNGQTLVVGGGMPDREGGELSYLLITLRLVDAGGKPWRRPDPVKPEPGGPAAPRPPGAAMPY